jgi:hypothetical protein
VNILLPLLRFLSIGDPDRKQLGIRLIAVAALVIVMVVWGINYRNQLPPSGIMGDTSPTLSPLEAVGTVDFDEPVEDSLGEGERHTWAFEGGAAQRVNIRVRGDWWANIELLPPNGDAPIARANSAQGAFLCNFRLIGAGTYRVIVSGVRETGGKKFGDYELSLAEENYVEEQPINFGDTVESRLTTCDGDFYTIALEQGDRLQVTVTPETGAETYLRLLSQRERGDLIAIGQTVVGEDGQSQEVAAVEALVDATFFIQVQLPLDAPEASYSISVSRLEEQPA